MTTRLSDTPGRVRWEKMEREDEEAEIDLEWKHLAAVLDRLFFWIYLISITISIVLLFPAM